MYGQMMEYQQGYGMGAYQQEMYYHQQHQQNNRQPMQYTPEQAMYLNSVQRYQHFQTAAMPMQTTNALDYQMTPALYVLNQQAKILEKSLLPGMIDQPVNKPKVRKQRGPYRKKNAKSPSPSPSAQSDSSACSSEDLTNSAERGLKRKINTSEDGQNHYQVNKQFKSNGQHSLHTSPAPPKASIFRSIDLLAQSSTNGRHC